MTSHPTLSRQSGGCDITPDSVPAEREAVRARCGPDRLWAFERVLDASLEQQDTRRLPEIGSRLDCLRHCLLEADFVCR